ADVVHFQWLTVPQLDGHLLPRRRPLVLTAHDVLPREPRPGQLRAPLRLLDPMDAIVVHSQAAADRLRTTGATSKRVHVIPTAAPQLVPPGAEDALDTALRDLIGDAPERKRLAAAVRTTAARPYSCDAVAEKTPALYRALV